jgi:hypothetical protein
MSRNVCELSKTVPIVFLRRIFPCGLFGQIHICELQHGKNDKTSESFVELVLLKSFNSCELRSDNRFKQPSLDSIAGVPGVADGFNSLLAFNEPEETEIPGLSRPGVEIIFIKAAVASW